MDIREIRLNACKQKIEELIGLANDHYKCNLRMPDVVDDLEGTVGGWALYKKWRIRLNWILLGENTKDFLAQTVPHEVAHLVAYKVFGETGHGTGWKRVMRFFGIEPKRCHDYDTHNSSKRTRPRPHLYICGCPGGKFWLTNNLHSKVSNGQRRWCRKCQVDLKFVLTKEDD